MTHFTVDARQGGMGDRLAFLLAGVLLGCGGLAEDVSDGGTDATSGAHDGGESDVELRWDVPPDTSGLDVNQVTVPCSTTAPAPGTSCNQPGELCEYGTDFWANCNVVLRCDPGSSQWTVQYAGKLCSHHSGDGCPASRSDIDAGGLCSPVGETCVYPEGFCECIDSCGGPPPGNPPPKRWMCPTPKPGCGFPRPLYGTPCSNEGIQCRYGLCCGGNDMACINGVWQGQFVDPGCP